jgi:hypothetical protein
MNPIFPLYIVSKGRWESRRTSRALELIGVPYSIVVEEQGFSEYASVIDKKKILVLDKRYQSALAGIRRGNPLRHRGRARRQGLSRENRASADRRLAFASAASVLGKRRGSIVSPGYLFTAPICW